MSKTDKVVEAGMAAVVLVFGLMMIVGVAEQGQYTQQFSVDTQTEWQEDEVSATNVEYTDGYLQLTDTQSSGSYTGSVHDLVYDNDSVTHVTVETDLPDGNDEVSATVTGYDSTDAQVDTTTVTLEDGTNRVDVSGFPDSAETFDVTYNFPEVTDTLYYEDSSTTPISLTTDTLVRYGTDDDQATGVELRLYDNETTQDSSTLIGSVTFNDAESEFVEVPDEFAGSDVYAVQVEGATTSAAVQFDTNDDGSVESNFDSLNEVTGTTDNTAQVDSYSGDEKGEEVPFIEFVVGLLALGGLVAILRELY